ncbi:MAG: histidinol dehydrogenase [Bacillota bacterium]
MNIYRLPLEEEKYRKLLQRAEADINSHLELAGRVCRHVQEQGDEALLYYTRTFDGVNLTRAELKVTEEELVRAFTGLDDKTRETLQYAAANIEKFHREQLPPPIWMKEMEQGVLAGEKVSPLGDVCLYVPRGKGSFPSVMLMLGIPAVVAGVPRVVVTTPPAAEREKEAATLAAAYIAGIKEVYRVGGMQAIAAVAYGTETIPPCRKVVGPGNAYVNAAKRFLYGVMDVGLPAGPSEAIILADASADPRIVALDLLIEAEHGPDSASLLVTHVPALAEAVPPLVAELLEQLPPEKRSYAATVFQKNGGIVLTRSLEESLSFVNEYAPEHLEVITADPFSLLPRIDNAGEILLGPHTPITLANFLMGPNAILPTGSFARSYSGISVHDFLKRSSFGSASPGGLARVREAAAHFAETEGFAAHAMAVRLRPVTHDDVV